MGFEGYQELGQDFSGIRLRSTAGQRQGECFDTLKTLCRRLGQSLENDLLEFWGHRGCQLPGRGGRGFHLSPYQCIFAVALKGQTARDQFIQYNP
jgi:hypothetical protein